MKTKLTSVDNLASEVADILSEFKGATYEALVSATDVVGKETADKVKSNIDRAGIQGYGEYKRSWTYSGKQIKSDSKYAGIVHAKSPHYRLTHLLEFGHALRQGGRTRAFPHIKPSEDWARDRLTDVLQEKIEEYNK